VFVLLRFMDSDVPLGIFKLFSGLFFSPVDVPLGGDSGQLYYLHQNVFMLASIFVVALVSTYCSLICI